MGMTARIQSAWGALTKPEERSWPTLSFDDYLSQVTMNGLQYLVGQNQSLRGTREEIDGNFAGLVSQAYKANGIVFACMLARMRVFRQARFQFQELRNGQPGKLFGSPALDIIEHPWPNGGTADLLARAIQDADLAGNFFCARVGNSLRRLRPDWVTIVLGSESDPDVEIGDSAAEVLGYIYHPGGKHTGREPEIFQRSEVAHFAPIPDPLASFRGMSWLTPIIREIQADNSMVTFKNLFFENGAAPSTVVSLDPGITGQAFRDWVELLKEKAPEGWNRYKTQYLGGGAKVEVIGSTLEQINFKAVQGAGETRIAAAAGVPPIIVGLSEGLQAATYSNYGQARRAFADNTLRDLWQDMATSLETVCPPPNRGTRLWVDDRHIQALAEDKKDLAEVRGLEAQQLKTLTDAGFKPTSVIDAVMTGDWTRLDHTGLFSVQLQPPMPEGPVRLPDAQPVPQIPATIPKRDELLLGVLRALAERPVNVNVDAPITMPPSPPTTVTFEEGAIRGGDTHITTPDVQVTVEPATVTIAEGAVQTTVEPPQLTISERAITLVDQVPMRTVIDRDETGSITGSHEEPV